MLGQFGQGHREVRNDIFIKMLANRNQGSKKLVSLRTTFQINQVVYFPGNNGKSGKKRTEPRKNFKPGPDGEGHRHIGVSSIGPNCAKPSSKATEPLEPGGQGGGLHLTLPHKIN